MLDGLSKWGDFAGGMAAATALARELAERIRDRRERERFQELLDMLISLQLRLLELQQVAADQAQECARLRQLQGEASQWQVQRAQCLPEVVGRTPVLTHPDHPGAYFCVTCTDRTRALVAFAEVAPDLRPLGRFHCASCDTFLG